ncbi:hypothetical protein GGX14DRAFT_666180 [Mycena pura]|uniref:Protein YAE1 n=1 Tax=Mycena pura TaxID=153505 RepID=A0AAD6V060_9AGAR|nr:hypothetical protein GGX14DRAFT_666180 [Mycena pura]
MDDSPWDEAATQETSRDMEWANISSQFTNSGYREGITAGKESALQEGFDAGFASVGVPLGRNLGFLRGVASALVAFLQSSMCQHTEKDALLAEARAIATRLAAVRFSDIVPPDLEAETHAREHLAEEDDFAMDENEGLRDRREMEGLEDMVARLSAGTVKTAVAETSRPTMDDVRMLEGRLHALNMRLGLDVNRGVT